MAKTKRIEATMSLLEPKEVEVNGKVYVISKFPAIAGREILTQYISTGLPKIGDYKANEELMLKLMCYVAVSLESGPLKLTTRALIDNHMGSGGWESLTTLEALMVDYNLSFFFKEKLSTSLGTFGTMVQEFLLKTLTGLSDVSSRMVKQPLTNSEPSTP